MPYNSPIAPPYQGTTQADMALPALDPSYFQVDERDLGQHLAFTAKLARAFNFYNLEDRVEGTWAQFLLAEPLFLTALIKETDTTALFSRATDFQAAILTANQEMLRVLFYQYFFETGFEVALSINQWYRHSARLFKPGEFSEYLQNLIREEAGPSWQQFYNQYATVIQAYGDMKNKMLHKTQLLDPIWHFDPFPSIDTTNVDAIQAAEQGREQESIYQTPAYTDWMDQVMADCQALFHLLDVIKEAASENFDKTLMRRDLPPQTGLMLSFFKLLKNEKALLNQATEKHLNFYYQDILKLQPRAATPDQCWLSFTLEKGQTSFDLPSGTEFKGGTLPGSTTPRTFFTQEALTVTTTQLGQYLTFALVPPTGFQIPTLQELISQSNAKASPLLQGLYTGQASTFGSLPSTYWPAFGQDLAGTSVGTLTTQNSPLGWSISTPDLWLGSGDRTLILRLTLEEQAGATGIIDALVSKWDSILTTHKQQLLDGIVPTQFPGLLLQLGPSAVQNLLANAPLSDLLAFLSNLSESELDYLYGQPDKAELLALFEGLQPSDFWWLVTLKALWEILKNSATTTTPENRISPIFKELVTQANAYQTQGHTLDTHPDQLPKNLAEASVNAALPPVVEKLLQSIAKWVSALTIQPWLATLSKTVLTPLLIETLFSNEITEAKQWAKLGYGFALTGGTLKPSGYQKIAANGSTPEQLVITLVFGLDKSQPGTAAYSSKVHGTGYNTTWPVLASSLTAPNTSGKGYFGQQFYLYFKELNLAKIDLSCQVDDFQGFILQNDDGPIDPTKPFRPFGTQPLQGSQLYLGSQELFSKQITHLDLNLTWKDLPVSKSFFQQYLAYNLHPLTSSTVSGTTFTKQQAEPYYLNSVFQLTVEGLTQGKWKFLGSTQAEGNSTGDAVYYSLFTGQVQNQPYTPGMPAPPNNALQAYQDEEADLGLTDQLAIDLLPEAGSDTLLMADPNLTPITKYTPAATDGFLRLLLANPVQGFGKEDYPRVVTEVTMINTGRSLLAAQNKQTPKPCSLEFLLNPTSSSSEANLPTSAKTAISDANAAVTAFKDLMSQLESDADTWSETLAASFTTEDLVKQILLNLTHSLMPGIKEFVEDLLKKLETLLHPTLRLSQADFVQKLADLKGKTEAELKTLDSNGKEWAENIVSKLNLGGVAHDLMLRLVDGISDPLKSEYDKLIGQFRDSVKGLHDYLNTELPSDLKDISHVASKGLDSLKKDLEALPESINKAITPEAVKADVAAELSPITKKIEAAYTDTLNQISTVGGTVDTAINSLISALEASYATCLEPQPNQPYIPTAQRLTINYTSDHSWTLSGSPDNFQLYQQGPWSTRAIPTPFPADQPWLPRFEDDAYAYFGLENYTLGEQLTLMLAVNTPVSFITKSSFHSLQVEYPYQGTWQTLRLDRDETQGGFESGIISFNLPTAVDVDSDLVTYAGKTPTLWLRMLQPKGLDVKAGFVATQAVSVQDTTAGLESLTAGTITKPLNNTPAIKTVQQPLASFGGRAQQTAVEARQSGAWRLNNKQRAARRQDYETLLLDAFPDLYQARVVSTFQGKLLRDAVNVLVIPQTQPIDQEPYLPAATSRELIDYFNYLENRKAPEIDLIISNPEYTYLNISGELVLANANEAPQQLAEVKTALQQYLSPWLQGNSYTDTQPDLWTSAAIYRFITQLPQVASLQNLACSLRVGSTEQTDSLVPPQGQQIVVAGSLAGITALNGVAAATQEGGTE